MRARSAIGLLLGLLCPFASAASDRLAVVVPARGAQQLAVLGADGAGRVLLTSGPGRNQAPAWSPDGRSIAYAHSRGTASVIRIVSADGKRDRTLTPSSENATIPAWSPDGQRIAFVAARAGDLAVWAMNADGTGERRVAEVAGDLSALAVFAWRPP